MAAIGGVTTSLDINRLVERAMSVERKPLIKLEKKKDTLTQAKVDWTSLSSALLSLKTKLRALRTQAGFHAKIISSSDSDTVAATANVDAPVTSYTLSSITLATAAQKTGSVLSLTGGTYTTLASTAEVYTGTSLVGTPSAWSASSLVTPTTGGVYTGIDNDTWMFTVDAAGGTIGTTAGLQITVTDQKGTAIATLNIGSTYTPGTALGIADGVTVSFDAGSVAAGEYFTVTAQSANVDPNNAFNGTGNDQPNLDSAVTAGNFTINNAIIQVAAGDTVYDILTKINSSSAGVTATYDSSTDRVTLTQKVKGNKNITLGSDSSGFLTAMKLSGASPVQGSDAEWDKTINTVSAFSGINNGYFTINDITFSVDTANESLQDILNKINNSKAGVSAFYDENLDKVLITAKETGKNITFGNDTSDFLAAVLPDLSPAAFSPAAVTVNGTALTPDGNTFTINDTTFTLHSNLATGSVAVQVSRDIDTATSRVQAFVDQYNAVIDLVNKKLGKNQSLEGSFTLESIKRGLRDYAVDEVSNPGQYASLYDIGISRDYSAGGKLSIDSSKLQSRLDADPESVANLFGYDSNNDGLRDDGGLAVIMETKFLSPLTNVATGDIAGRKEYIDTQLDRVSDKVLSMEKKLARRENQLRNNYLQLQDMLIAVQRMQQWTNTQLSSMSRLY